MNFLRGFSFNATTTGLIFFLGFFNQALLAEHLGQANFGHLKLWFTTVLLASLFLGEWLSKGNTYVMGKGEGKGAVICNTLIYGLGLGLLLLLIAGFCMHFTGSFFLEINQFQWPLLAGLIVLTLMQKSILSHPGRFHRRLSGRQCPPSGRVGSGPGKGSAGLV